MIDEKKLEKDIAGVLANAVIELCTGKLIFDNMTCKIVQCIRAQPKVGEWNVITYCEEDGYLYNLPEDGQRVLVSYKGRVSEDEFIDGGTDGVYFDSGMDVDVGMAWQPLPEPYHIGDSSEMEGAQK